MFDISLLQKDFIWDGLLISQNPKVTCCDTSRFTATSVTFDDSRICFIPENGVERTGIQAFPAAIAALVNH